MYAIEIEAKDTYVLDEFAHARLRDTTTAEDLYSISCGVLSTAGAVHFQQPYWSIDEYEHRRIGHKL